MNVIPTDSDFQWTKPLRQTQAWPKHTEGEQNLCALFSKGSCSGLERGSVRSQWDSKLHHQWPKAGQFLQPELLKSNLDGGEVVLLECSPGTRVLGTEDEGHQAAGHSQALDRGSHSSSSITWIEVTLSLLQTWAVWLQNQALMLKRFRIGFGQSKHWPRQKI